MPEAVHPPVEPGRLHISRIRKAERVDRRRGLVIDEAGDAVGEIGQPERTVGSGRYRITTAKSMAGS